MGQANKRGSKEEREKQGITKRYEQIIAVQRYSEQHPPKYNPTMAMLMSLGIGMGVGLGLGGGLGAKTGLYKIDNLKIRRLTPVECERLQGFPDDWTKYGIYEKQVWINKKLKTFEIVEELKEIPKTQRYKMCGNAVTTDAVEAIAENLKLT